MNKILLSICIPTYNRSEYLKKSIESIIIQPEFKEGLVEIVISDNASTDDTEILGTQYAEEYDNISYFRNELNIRDRNFPLALGRAHGLLRKLSNDTLIYHEHSLKSMCEIVLNYKDEKPFIFWKGSCGEIDDNELFGSLPDFLRSVSFWITSIACFSIWDDECTNIQEDIDGCEYLLWQVKKALELSSKGNSLICNSDLTSVQYVGEKDISYGLYQVFYENYFALIEPYIDRDFLSAEDKEYLEKDLLYNFFTDWCIRWEIKRNVKGTARFSEDEDLKQCIFQKYMDKPYWNDYLKYYKKKYIKARTKEFAKNVLQKIGLYNK